jgi:hypothetical protein
VVDAAAAECLPLIKEVLMGLPGEILVVGGPTDARRRRINRVLLVKLVEGAGKTSRRTLGEAKRLYGESGEWLWLLLVLQCVLRLG